MERNLSDLLTAALEVARDAGRVIMEVYGTEFDVDIKADRSPLTEADRRAHELITGRLADLTPDLPILSEESFEDIDPATRSQWSEYWLVDPLDGTKEFIRRNGEFTVNIALISGQSATLGVVYVPARGECYYGGDQQGAWWQRGNAEPSAIQVEIPARSPVRVVGSRSHGGSSLDAYLNNLGEHVMVPMGSSLKLCLVAAGEADVYPRLGPTSEWDTAAAQAVLEAAGGAVVKLDGRPLRYNKKDEILNPFFIAFGDRSRDWTAFC